MNLGNKNSENLRCPRKLMYLGLCQTIELFLLIEFEMKFLLKTKSLFNVSCLSISHVSSVNKNHIFDAKNVNKRQQLLVIIPITHEL